VPPLEPQARRPQPIEQSTDFERVLRARSLAQTQHFAVHHLPDRPSLSARARRAAISRKLSTGDAPEAVKPVDDLAIQLWVGAVVPKRHARRAVTRSLLKRHLHVRYWAIAAMFMPEVQVVASCRRRNRRC
jgi:ribonuclease P protein component